MTFTNEIIAKYTLTHLFHKPTCHKRYGRETGDEKYRYNFWSKMIHANKNKD